MLKVIGLMSGTSLDGVDVALLETDGETIHAFGASGGRGYTNAERATLKAALEIGRTLTDRTARPGLIAQAEAIITSAHAEAVEQFLALEGFQPEDIDLIGFHGQTIFHKPEAGLTIQIGDAAALAKRLGIPVIADFRAADVAAGGQGAPLVPIYHATLASHFGLATPVAVVNIGGVANVTVIGSDGGLSAFDTGPGNALIDDLMFRRTGTAMDRGGAAAAGGTVDERALRSWLAHPYFAARPPKSLDRNAWQLADTSHLSLEDAAATLTAFTAHTLALGFKAMPEAPHRAIIAGGGARNETLLSMLKEIAKIEIMTADALGLSGDSLEAEAFAFLAARSQRGLPISFPGTTGIKAPLTGGVRSDP